MLYDKKWDKVKVETLEPWQTLLQATIGVLEKKGWCQGAMENGNGAHCLMGAMNAAEGALGISYKDQQRAMVKFQRMIRGDNVARWNDARGRTKAEVIDALRKAIASK